VHRSKLWDGITGCTDLQRPIACKRAPGPVTRPGAGIAYTMRMRLMLYNIRYGTGTGAQFHWPVPGAGMVLGNHANLARITDFIKSQDPDIVGLIEVDAGSIRSRRVNQAEAIARELGHYSAYQCKYGTGSLNNRLPIVRKQGNAFLASPRVAGERFHYFETGIKRLIIELELDDFAIFLVHLSLKYRHRHFQLRHLYDLISEQRKPVIVAGDFNTFWGGHEIYLFMKAAGLRSANVQSLPTYPSNAARRELDFVLYSQGIEVTSFKIPQVRFSDHLPLVCDFEITDAARPPQPALAKGLEV
jgi:endonuclease/exonuclease/phosphatase family metal-dependent hydrolase